MKVIKGKAFVFTLRIIELRKLLEEFKRWSII